MINSIEINAAFGQLSTKDGEVSVVMLKARNVQLF
jgi:hypothetical protein